jgi:alcohol dehydrogenase
MNPLTVELRKFVVPEIIYGIDALQQTGRSAKRFGAKKALVVTDPGVMRAGWTGAVLNSLNEESIPAAVFQELTPNPKDYEVAAGADFYQANHCDVIVAVGGGSPMDCAKGIGIVCSNGKHILEYEGVDEVPLPIPPLICVPTTAGSSADVSQFAIITDSVRKVKIAIISKTVVPDLALIDPQTTTTMPADLTAATGMDALVHAMESYVSNACSPLTDLHALEAISLIASNLVRATKDPANLEFRKRMMLGSMLAGLAFSNASLGLVHAMAHSLGGLLDLPHGICNALLLDRVVDFNYQEAAERYDQIGRALGLDLDGLEPRNRQAALIKRIGRLREEAGIKKSDLNVDLSRQDISRLAAAASNDPCLATNPRKASAPEIENLYEQAFRKS